MYFRNGSQNDDFIFNEIISGAIVDNELEFELNIKNVCKQAARKQMQPQGKTARNKAAKKKELSDIVSKQLSAALLSYGLLFPMI